MSICSREAAILATAMGGGEGEAQASDYLEVLKFETT
jgi:hypothetical protein